MANIYLPNRPLPIDVSRIKANTTISDKISTVNKALSVTGYQLTVSSQDHYWDISYLDDGRIKFYRQGGECTLTIKNENYKNSNYKTLKLSNNNNIFILIEKGKKEITLNTGGSFFLPCFEYTYILDVERNYLWEDEPLSKIGAYISDLPTNKVKTYNNLKSYTSQWNTSNAVFGGFTKYLIQDKQCISGFVDLQNQHINLKKNQYRSGDDLIAGINSNDFLNIIDSYPILLATNITENKMMENPKICYNPKYIDSSGVTHDAKINILTKDYFISFDPTDVLIFYQDTDFTEHPITNPIMRDAIQTTTQRKEEYTLQVDYKFNQYLYQFSRGFDFQNGEWYKITTNNLEQSVYKPLTDYYTANNFISGGLPYISTHVVNFMANTNNYQTIVNYAAQYTTPNTFEQKYKNDYIDGYKGLVNYNYGTHNSRIIDLDMLLKINNFPYFRIPQQIFMPSILKNQIADKTTYNLNFPTRGYWGTDKTYHWVNYYQFYCSTSYGQDNTDKIEGQPSGIPTEVTQMYKSNSLLLSHNLLKLKNDKVITVDGLNDQGQVKWRSHNVDTDDLFYYTLVTRIQNQTEGFYAVFVQPKDIVNFKYSITKI